MKPTLRVLLAGPLLLPVSAWGQVTNQTTGIGYGTIQAAITAAGPGDILELDAGTYSESIQVTESVEIVAPTIP